MQVCYDAIANQLRVSIYYTGRGEQRVSCVVMSCVISWQNSLVPLRQNVTANIDSESYLTHHP